MTFGLRRPAIGQWIAILALLVLVIAACVEPAFDLRLHIPRGYNEGWNAAFIHRAFQDRLLYPESGLVTNNYPPVSFYLVRPLGRWLGDDLIAGRLVASAAWLVVAAGIYRWLRVAGCATRNALFGAVVFLSVTTSFAPWYVGTLEPQWLAHAFAQWALIVVSRHRERPRSVVLCAALMTVAGFTKHIVVAAPIAIACWYGSVDRRSFRRFIMALAVCTVAGVALASWWYGSVFLQSLFFVRRLDAAFFVPKVAWAIRFLGPLAVVAVVTGNDRHPLRRLVAWYLLASTLSAFAAAWGDGVDVNAFFDLIIALSMALGLAAETSAEPGWVKAPLSVRALMLPVVVCYLLFRGIQTLPDQWTLLRTARVREVDAAKMIDLASHVQGEGVACENQAYCYWAGVSSTIDFFTYGQGLWTRHIPGASCHVLFSNRGIAGVHLVSADRPYRSDLLPDECNTAIRANYHPVFESQTAGVWLALNPR